MKLPPVERPGLKTPSLALWECLSIRRCLLSASISLSRALCLSLSETNLLVSPNSLWLRLITKLGLLLPSCF